MKIHLVTLKRWAALKPPATARPKARNAWRRFALVRINGQPLAVPAKAALKWARATGVESVEINGLTLRAECGASRIALKCWADSIPAEKSYDPSKGEATVRQHGRPLLDRVSVRDMWPPN